MRSVERRRTLGLESLGQALQVVGFTFALLAMEAAQVLAQTRVALLIGNADYALDRLDLDNPVNDVNALETKLTALGFEVKKLRNAEHTASIEALDWLEQRARSAEQALFFYAGHGVQLGGENYLVGTDLVGFQPQALVQSSLDLSRIKTALLNGPKISIIIIDACRNNPFLDTDWVVEGLAVSGGGPGMLIAYATDPGNVAYDGTGQNSVFTRALLDNIAEPNLDVRLMFGRVRQDVVRSTGGAQVPWVEESVLGEHVLVPGVPRASQFGDDEVALWRGISASRSVRVFENYLEKFPRGLFAEFAKDRISLLSEPASTIVYTGPQSTEDILASANRELVLAALDQLGFIDKSRGLTIVDADLAAAFDAYRAQTGLPERASAESLSQDAARLIVFFAASTGQRIRTDFAALAGIEKTLDVANDTFMQLKLLTGEDDEYASLLAEAEKDIDAIYASRQAVRDRLDVSRTYYDQLLVSAQDNFADLIGTGILQGGQMSRSVAHLKGRLLEDARIFVRHVQARENRARGSYAWITDFMTKT